MNWVLENIYDHNDTHKFMLLSKTLKKMELAHILVIYNEFDDVEDSCGRCGFIAENKCQLDVDHIDGDKNNSDPSNLQTLCANCHRLKTLRKSEYLNKY